MHLVPVSIISLMFNFANHSKDKILDRDLKKNYKAIMRNVVSVYEKYKFVIAFELRNSSELVTEKIFNAWMAGAVPIYMGSANIDKYVPGDNSYIRASDFDSPKALSDYIKQVSHDEDLYKSFHTWRDQPLRQEFLDHVDKCYFNEGTLCKLCNEVHDHTHATSEAAGYMHFNGATVLFYILFNYRPYNFQIRSNLQS